MVLNLVDPKGAPVPDARVKVDLFRTSGRADEAATRVVNLAAVSDANGCARVELEPDLALHCRAWIAAARMPELACKANRVLDPPLAANPHTIELLPTGSILVRVTDRTGRPAMGISVEARARSELPIPALAPVRSDANGELRFDELPAGTYVVTALGPRASPGSRAVLNTGRGVCVDVEIVIEDSAREVAVSGVVLDEHGEGLANVYVRCRTLPKGEIETLDTSKDGTFELVSTRTETVELALVQGMFDIDEFEPMRIEVPFGSTNVSFRRVRVLPRISVMVRLVDADDRHVLADGSATLCPRGRHGGVNETSGQPLYVLGKLHPDWIYILRAPGHKSRVGSLEELQRMAEAQQVTRSFPMPPNEVIVMRSVELALEKGFDEEFAVRESQNAEPIAGVMMTTSDGDSQTTDAQGFVAARAPTWPRSIKFEHEGFVPVEVVLKDGFHSNGEILMQRLPH
jgi:hypothetical protein